MILCLDTSAGRCGVGLGNIARSVPMTRGHAEALFPMIDEVLAAAGAVYDDISRVAVCTGPGSFTGTRIGVAAARGLALGLGVPAIGVSRFDVLGQGLTGYVALRSRGEAMMVQRFVDGRAAEEPFSTLHLPKEEVRGDAAPGKGEAQGWPDLGVMATIAAGLDPGVPPAPLYLRPADAAPPRETAPLLLDG